MSLCYYQATKAREAGTISDELYYRDLFSHVNGTRHAMEDQQIWPMIEEYDPVAHLVRKFAHSLDHVIESQPFEDVFTAYRSGEPASVTAKLGALGEYEQDIRECVAQAALRDRNPVILKLCLDEGISFQPCFCIQANRVDPEQDPKTYQVLEQDPHFRKSRPDRNTVNWWNSIPW